MSLSSPEFSDQRSVSTTTEGVFEFKDLPAGRYTVTASRSGFLRLQYGQRSPGEPGRPLQIADGQTIDRVEFALPRMSVITGHVTDEVGDLLAGVSIFLMQVKYFRGKRRLVPLSSGASTDDTGQFRLIGLQPGDYYLMGTTRETWTVEGDDKQRIGFAPTYYSGTSAPADAQRVKLRVGQELAAIDFAMVTGRAPTISGTVISQSGLPVGGELVGMSQEFAGPTMTSSFGFAAGKINPDGSFAIRNVAPGEYKLSVRIPGDKGPRRPRRTRRPRYPPSQPGGLPEGEYLVAARDFMEDGSWNDPEVLKALVEGATKVTLRQGQGAAGVSVVLKK